MHIDHVLGLPDVPKGTPILVGPGEIEQHGVQHLLFGRAVGALVLGHALETFDFARGRPLESIKSAIDVFGDGSFFSLHVPGHTDGSTAFLARTSSGPVLFTGDCSHTLWGWENGVPPGLFTGDGAANARSLTALKRLAAAHRTMKVVVGHETDGVGTGFPPFGDHEARQRRP
jgi:glyoxylase-like metal-dependent hydrolase (beta-lactamase superfamily II)